MSDDWRKPFAMKWGGLLLFILLFLAYTDFAWPYSHYAWFYDSLATVHVLVGFLTGYFWYVDRLRSKRRFVFIKPSRWRRVAKWVAAVICICLFGLWRMPSLGEVNYTHGRFSLRWYDRYVYLLFDPKPAPTRLTITPEQYASPLGFSLDVHLPLGKSSAWFGFPLAFPFFIVAAATILLWRRDRRSFGPAQCRACGYDLTGNVSGICPECGVPIGERSPTVALLSQGDQQPLKTSAGDQGPAPPTPPPSPSSEGPPR